MNPSVATPTPSSSSSTPNTLDSSKNTGTTAIRGNGTVNTQNNTSPSPQPPSNTSNLIFPSRQGPRAASSHAASSAKKYGVTDPISVAGPTPASLKLTEDLKNCLQTSDFFESPAEGKKRQEVLGRLNGLIQKFIKDQADASHLPTKTKVQGKIYTFGSYRLGVHSRGADIDTLCVAPQHIGRQDFFEKFYVILEVHPLVSELTRVQEAYVPVIKMMFDGVPIDLVFARVPLLSVPDDFNLLDNAVLRALEEKCILSLNGPRTTDEMLQLVPCIETFHVALRCIKLWAKRRGIYSNMMGYCAGVAWALLTARICQLYPNASPSTIISKLFHIYSVWAWPQPVMLKSIEDDPSLGMKVWNAQLYPSDRYHRMPVITPAYPSICSTHNVTLSTLRLMTEEFQRGQRLLSLIEEGKAVWPDLFEPSPFFSKHKHFFQILSVAESHEDHLIWSGFVGSKVRFLIPKLEFEEFIDAAPPYHEGFEVDGRADDTEEFRKTFHCYRAATSDNDSSSVNNTANDQSTPTAKKNHYHSTAFYIALIIAPKTQKGPRRICLDDPINALKEYLTQWESMAPGMHLIIKDIKRDQLPAYVWQDGKRPPRTKSIPRSKSIGGGPVSGSINLNLDSSHQSLPALDAEDEGVTPPHP